MGAKGGEGAGGAPIPTRWHVGPKSGIDRGPYVALVVDPSDPEGGRDLYAAIDESSGSRFPEYLGKDGEWSKVPMKGWRCDPAYARWVEEHHFDTLEAAASALRAAPAR